MTMDPGLLYTIIGSSVATIAVMLVLFIYLASKIDNLTLSVYSEMKDFHARLAVSESKKTKKETK